MINEIFKTNSNFENRIQKNRSILRKGNKNSINIGDPF